MRPLVNVMNVVNVVTVSDRDWLLPTVTLPKLRLLGLDPSAPGATPVPHNGMLRLGLDAVEESR